MICAADAPQDPRVRRKLLDLTSERSPLLVRARAAEALWNIGKNPEAVRVLSDMARTDVNVVRYNSPGASYALVALGEIGPEAKAAIPVVQQAIRSPQQKLRSYAMRAIRKIDPKAARQTEAEIRDSARAPQ
ncbi:MAG: hypothetical protein N2C14_03930 [Planctomycetales bacterium]